jgi:hypothetical protein
MAVQATPTVFFSAPLKMSAGTTGWPKTALAVTNVVATPRSPVTTARPRIKAPTPPKRAASIPPSSSRGVSAVRPAVVWVIRTKEPSRSTSSKTQKGSATVAMATTCRRRRPSESLRISPTLRGKSCMSPMVPKSAPSSGPSP